MDRSFRPAWTPLVAFPVAPFLPVEGEGRFITQIDGARPRHLRQYSTDDPEEIPNSPLSAVEPPEQGQQQGPSAAPAPLTGRETLWNQALVIQRRQQLRMIARSQQDHQSEAGQLTPEEIGERQELPQQQQWPSMQEPWQLRPEAAQLTPDEMRERWHRVQQAQQQQSRLMQQILAEEGRLTADERRERQAFGERIRGRLAPPHVQPTYQVRRSPNPVDGLRYITYTIQDAANMPWVIAIFDWREELPNLGHTSVMNDRGTRYSNNVAVNMRVGGMLGIERLDGLVWFELSQAVEMGFIFETVAEELWSAWCGSGDERMGYDMLAEEEDEW